MKAWLLIALIEILAVNMNTRASAAGLSASQYIRLGRQALLHGHPNAAHSYFSTALSMLRVHPQAPQSDKLSALSGLGFSDLWLGQDLAARQVYSEALKLAQNPADIKAMRLGLGRALNGLGQSRQAYDLLQKDIISSHQAALQSAVAANLLGWNTRAKDLLSQAAPDTNFVGPNWQKTLYDQTYDNVTFAVKPSVNFGFQYSGDNDHNTSQTSDAGVVKPGSGLGDNALSPTLWSMQYQQVRLGSTIGSADISAISGGLAAPVSPDWSYSLQVGFGKANSWSFGTVTGDLSYQPSDNFGLELAVDRQPVAAVQAVRNRIMQNTVSMDGFGMLPGVGTVAGSYFNQSFSDGNNRNGFIMRVTPTVYSFTSVPISLGVQGLYRYYESAVALSDGYFNPRHYSQAIGYLIYTQKFASVWKMQIHAGLGSQTVDSKSTPVEDFYGSVTGSVSRYFQVNLSGGYSQIPSVSGGGSGYSSSYGQANLLVPF